MPSSPATLVDLLRSRADRDYGYEFILGEEADGTQQERLSYAELDRRARAIGAALTEEGMGGERVLIVYPPGLDYVCAFFGCLYAGAVAVPVFPPDPSRLDRTLSRFLALATDARPRGGLTSSPVLPWLHQLAQQAGSASALAAVRWLATDAVPDSAAQDWSRPAVGPEDTAFIQYTSGSTSEPKGVVLSHTNLLHNSMLVQHAFRDSSASRAMSWLPLYHDMGLIGGVLQPLYADFPILLMSPLGFLARPLAWLRVISRHQITISGGPNFAYDLCARKFDPGDCEGLDLSSWEVAFNGAEPVRDVTLDRFADTFEPYGFRRTSFLSCYGLAESTLIVTASRAGAEVRRQAVSTAELGAGTAREPADQQDTTVLLSTGSALPGMRVVVVESVTGTELPDRSVGEIRVSGPSVSAGYWADPAQTATVFIDRGPDGRWLRTGDLGFLDGGELFVTGRAKDVMIVRGRNVYPQDIEQAAVDAGFGLRPGCVAAFGVEDVGEERVVLVGEMARGVDIASAGGPAGAVRRALDQALDIAVHAVVLVEAGTIPKTSSGKIRRHACRQAYLAGELAVLGQDAAGDPIRQPVLHPTPDVDPMQLRAGPRDQRDDEVLEYLSAVLAEEGGLDADELSGAALMNTLGLSSLASMQALHRIEKDLRVVVPVDTLLQPRPLREVAAVISAELDRPPAVHRGGGAGAGSPLISEGQRALWFLRELDPDSPAYHLARAFTVGPGEIDAPALDRALRTVVERHTALRTTFTNVDGVPVAALAPVPDTMLEVVAIPAVDLAGRLDEEAGRRFDLAAAPLIRAVLYQPDSGSPVLLVVVHHIAADLWSFGILLRELRALYPALVAGRPIELDQPTQYAGYVRRQVEELRAGAPRLREFWSHELAGELPVLTLPDRRVRPAVQSSNGATCRQDVDPVLSDRIRQLAAESGTTTYLVLLTALQVVLQRYSGQDDILVGTPAADRRDVAFASTVGYLLNTLVLRADLAGDPTFAELLARNRHTRDAALSHQSYPFARLVKEHAGGQDPSYSPLFQVMFTFEQAVGSPELAALAVDERQTRLVLGDVTLVSSPLPHRAATFDLTLRIGEVDGRLLASWEFNTDVLDAGTVEQIGAHLTSVLECAVAEPGSRIGELAVTGDDELAGHQQRESSQPRAPTDRCMHELVKASAEAEPDAIAVRAGEVSLSYGGLLDKATVLAERLQQLGVGPESRVGVYLPRSPEAIVAILGVLLAGGGYVPVDPGSPSERAAHILCDARVSVVLTRAGTATPLPDADTVRVDVGDVGTDWGRPTGRLQALARPDNLAYVMYTSGSTGRPKGIQVTHANLVSSTHARLDFFPDRVGSFLLISSLGFDSSLAGLFWTLYEGGTLVLPDPDLDQDPEHHRQLLATHAVTHFESVPSLYSMLLRLLSPGELPGLRSVVVAGEACPREVYDRHREVLPEAKLVNEYGPTEGTVWCSAYRASPDLDRPELPIGAPIANSRLYLLNRYGRPAPPGVVGEIHIGGAGVARGYFGQPGLTAERFLPDRMAEHPGSRLYRTGDLARQLPGGELEFVGRSDRQLNIHGVRIELNEIEAALRACPGIGEAVVRPVRQPGRDATLVAYVVAADPGAVPADDEVRTHLLDRLLTAMIPSALVWLPALPLTAHGKIDEHGLPEVNLDEHPLAPAGAEADQLAGVLCGMFADLLDLPAVGVHDDFFARGGHSLLVTQLVSRVRHALNVELPVRTVFQARTPAGLADIVRAERRGAHTSPEVELRKADRTEPLPLSYAQRRLWFVDRLLKGHPAYNIPIAARLRGRLDRGALAATLDDVVRRHEALRTTIEETDGEPSQWVHAAAPVTMDVVDAAELSGSELDARMAAAAREPFDLSTGPLLRVTLYRVTERDHVLLVVLHHIVADGWSLAVLSDEIAVGYRARLRDLPDPTPAPRIQYADYAVWQRDRFDHRLAEDDLAHWFDQLSDSVPLRLPTDRPRPPVQTFVGGTEFWELDTEVTDAVRAVCHTVDGTLFMVLLTAFGVMLGRQSYASDVVVGTPISGRTHLETEDLIGFFANTLALRLDLAGDPTFVDLVGRVREVCLDAYAHQDVPFELLVEKLQPTRQLGRNPVFQVVFALQNAPRRTPQLEGLEAQLLDVTTATAKFDLTVSLWEADGVLRGGFEYNRDLFDAPSIGRFCADFTRVVRAIADDPRRTLSSLTNVTAGSGDHSAAAVQAPPAWPERRSFARQAVSTPEAVAVWSRGREMSYLELASSVAQVAQELRDNGAGPGTQVGLCVDQPTAWLSGLLAILDTGATCVLMDPRQPSSWHDRVVDSSAPNLLLAQDGVRPGQPAPAPAAPDPLAAWPALLCFTDDAGNGIVSDRDALDVRVAALADALAVDANDRVLVRAPRWTEQAVWECLIALTRGAALLLPSNDTGADDAQPTVVIAEPSALPGLIAGHMASLRVLCVGAEPPVLASPSGTVHFVPALPLAPATTLWSRDADERWYGRALDAAQAAVLDRFGQPVEPGVPGQLHVAGPQLATGFLARPDLTAAELAPGNGAGRWHPTGVLVRRRCDGAGLEWLGPVRIVSVERDDEVPYVAPRTAVEHVVAMVWEDLLEQGPIGALDDFFEVGGHSLLATRVIARLRGIFQAEVAIEDFFGDATVAGVSEAIVALENVPGQADRIAELWQRVKAQEAPDDGAPDGVSSVPLAEGSIR